ncbi:MAG: DUF2878 domain-containing protein [Hyphomicrobiaceae bacterium]|nr:DUF2878 domain-containing protein [Hyphomicrobiaceae bacterium]
MFIALKIIAFQAVWLTCALGAAAGTNWPGVAAAVALVGWHLATAPALKHAAATVVLAGLLGALAETALVVSGLVTFGATVPPWPIPPWIVALWVAFATTLPILNAWIGPARSGWPWTAAALGLVAGPIAYIAGERLGALTLAPVLSATWWLSVVAIATVWAIATPLLLALSDRLPTQSPA